MRFPRPQATPKPGRLRYFVQILCVVLVFAACFAVGYFALQPIDLQTPPSNPPTGLINTSITTQSHVSLDYRAVGEELDPDIMRSTPNSFDPAIVNPCWDVSTAPKCLPQFYFLGGFQSGSNTLYEKVAQHPGVAKEHNSRFHFWSEPEKAFDAYLTQLAPAFPSAVTKSQIIGDASESSFAFYWAAGGRAHRAFGDAMRPCWDNCSRTHSGNQDKMWTCMQTICFPAAQAADHKAAQKLGVAYLDLQLPVIMRAAYRDHLPSLVILLRNPIRRLHTAFWEYPHYKGKYGATPQGFLAYVTEQLGAFRACVSRGHSDVECALLFESLGRDEEAVFFHCDQIFRGMYSLYVRVWLQHFPRHRILFIRSEDYFADASGTVKAVFGHLKLPAVPAEELARFVQTHPHKSYAKEHEPMLPEAWKLLYDFYKPYNQQLAKLLGDPKFGWPEDKDQSGSQQKLVQANVLSNGSQSAKAVQQRRLLDF